MLNFDQKNLGEFQEVTHGKYFTYRKTTDMWAIAEGFQHEIDVLDGIRFANVKKTVVHVCVDEDANGVAIVEKWNIKRHNIYPA